MMIKFLYDFDILLDIKLTFIFKVRILHMKSMLDISLYLLIYILFLSVLRIRW